jgi:hypothetical protein
VIPGLSRCLGPARSGLCPHVAQTCARRPHRGDPTRRSGRRRTGPRGSDGRTAPPSSGSAPSGYLSVSCTAGRSAWTPGGRRVGRVKEQNRWMGGAARDLHRGGPAPSPESSGEIGETQGL